MSCKAPRSAQEALSLCFQVFVGSIDIANLSYISLTLISTKIEGLLLMSVVVLLCKIRTYTIVIYSETTMC